MPTVGGIVTACYVLRVAELEAGSVGGGWPSFLPRGGGGGQRRHGTRSTRTIPPTRPIENQTAYVERRRARARHLSERHSRIQI